MKVRGEWWLAEHHPDIPPQKEEGKMKVRGCGDGVFVESYRI